MSQIKVYDEEGKMFEMSPANARDMMQHKGWTAEPPRVIVKEAEADEGNADDAPADAPEDETPDNPGDAAPVAPVADEPADEAVNYEASVAPSDDDTDEEAVHNQTAPIAPEATVVNEGEDEAEKEDEASEDPAPKSAGRKRRSAK